MPRYHLTMCAACGRLYPSKRAHQMTCSGACRTRLHRHPAVRAELEAQAADMARLPARRRHRLRGPFTPGLVLRLRALARAFPDLYSAVQGHEITLAQATALALPRAAHAASSSDGGQASAGSGTKRTIRKP